MNKDDVLKMIDEITEPTKMTKAEAKEWLTDLQDDIDTRLEALDAELMNEEAK
jgi:hypothetical protein